MRVLVAMPILREKRYRPALDAALSLEWPERLDYLMLMGGDESELPFQNIQVKYEEARQLALARDYEALLTLESDMIVPPDALMKLAEVEADVVYGLYVWRGPIPFWNAYSHLSHHIGRSMTMDRERARESWGKVVEVAGIGHGCTLIHRRVLEALPFRLADDMDYCCDWTMGLDCQAQGFVQKAHLGVICGHIRKDEPKVAWPDITKHNFYRWAKPAPNDAGLLIDGLTYERNTHTETVEGSASF